MEQLKHRFPKLKCAQKQVLINLYSTVACLVFGLLVGVQAHASGDAGVQFEERSWLRPRPHWCVFIWKRIFFDALSPSVPHTKTMKADSQSGGFRKRIVWTAKLTKVFDLHIVYILHNAPSIKTPFLRFSVDGRKRYENASVDVELLLRFEWNENGGVWKRISVWTMPNSGIARIATSVRLNIHEASDSRKQIY